MPRGHEFAIPLSSLSNKTNDEERKLNMDSRKKEAGDHHHTNNSTKFSSRTTTTPSSSRQSWATFKNPRIVRVSRTFGGKDRHSKVCTIRGLRDRRIRLSVPTAIQLYDLQERLGLNQPSKVVDWLLDVTKDEIDKLPPLQIPPTMSSSFPQFFNPNTTFMKDGVKINDHFVDNFREKSILGKEKWIASSDEQENKEGNTTTTTTTYVPILSSQSLFQLGNQSLAQFGNHSFSSSQIENYQQQHFPISLASSNSFPNISNSQQLYFCPNGSTFSSIIPPYNMTSNLFNSSLISQQVCPNSLGTTLQLINSKGLNSQRDDDDPADKGGNGS